MKIFIPLSDTSLGESSELYQKLVPFDPSYLDDVRPQDEGRKPYNWIADCNGEQARARLFESATRDFEPSSLTGFASS